MINLILHYLLALPDNISHNESSHPTSISDARKRKSMDLATMMASKSTDTAVTPLLFNLVDLILACLRSQNQQTIQTTLQLVSAILKRHHRYAVITLLKTEILPANTIHRTIGAHEQEVEYLVGLAGTVGGQDNFDEVYDDMCKDTMARLEGHPCSIHLVAPVVGRNNYRLTGISDSLPGAPRDVREHTVRPDDPLLNALLDILETFFMNAVETNLSVTETLVDLGICGHMSIEGWLSRNPNKYTYQGDSLDPSVDSDADSDSSESDQESSDEASISTLPTSPEDNVRRARAARDAREADKEETMGKCRRRPEWDQSTIPRFLDLIKRLCDQVGRFKETVPRFEELLQQRREAFYTADMILSNPVPPRKETPAQQTSPERASMEEGLRSQSPGRLSAFEGFAQRLLSDLGTPSRSGSPRGRKEKLRSNAASSGNATPSHRIDDYGLLTPTPKAIPIPPTQDFFSVARTLSPSRIGGDIGLSFDSQDGMFASRMADFAAVDQTILARRVGMPKDKLAPIPIKFDKPRMVEVTRPKDENDDDHDDDGDDEEEDDSSEQSSEDEEDSKDQDELENDDTKSGFQDEARDAASVSHIITNVIIFQSFVFELASLVQVRAGLFNEVRFA